MYLALYRKWRPLDFGDVVSQPAITTTLQNQIANGKIAHAYLFTGSRGTGKTTCARIFAKSVNCLNPKNGNPCLECDICKSADSGTLPDIIEIDAASNTGVDDIRELRESTNFTPEKCKFKIYIIDEVHMLSNNAFNAFLKLMEEPPSYVIFILATTEIHKVPATILSRCQRFDFRRILPEDIAGRIEYVAGQEGISITHDAAELIAGIADGGMRDALSLLDQCVAYSNEVDIKTVSFAAGIAGRDYLFDILSAISEKDCAKAIGIVDSLYAMSKDVQRLCEELLSQMRNLMLIKTVPENAGLITCLPSEREKLSELASRFELSQILDKLSILQECNERLPRAVSKRVEVEMCLVKLCSDNAFSKNSPQSVVSGTGDAEISALNAKIARLEQTIAQLSSGARPAKSSTREQPTRPDEPFLNEPPSVTAEPAPVVDLSKITPDMLTELDCWNDILERFNAINPAVSGALINSKAYTYENVMLIISENEFFMKLFKIKSNAVSLGSAIKDYLGKSFIIRAKCAVGATSNADNPINKLIAKAQASDVKVEIK